MANKNLKYPPPMTKKEAIAAKFSQKYFSIKHSKKTGRGSKKGKKRLIVPHKKQSCPLKKIVHFVSNTVDISSILEETVEILSNIIDATARIYTVDTEKDELFYNINGTEIRCKINTTSTVASNVAFNREYILLSDISYNEKYPEGIGFIDNTIQSVLCVPIVLPDNNCYGVIELYRKDGQEVFSIDNVKLIVVICGWMGAAIHQNIKRIALESVQELNNCLIDSTKKYFSAITNLDGLLSEIMVYAKQYMDAQKGSFYILDTDEEQLIANIYNEAIDGSDILQKRNLKINLSNGDGIINRVFKTSTTINAEMSENDDYNLMELSRNYGFHVKSLLCVPIMGLGGILGAIQLINKKDNTSFTNDDEILCKTFTVYCALALHFSNQTLKMQDKLTSNEALSELLDRHIKPCLHDVTELENRTFLQEYPANIADFDWYIADKDHEIMPQLALMMIVDIAGELSIDFEALKTFVLTVRKGYRNRPYHNFEHAFTFMHCVYCVLKRNKNAFSEIESKALIISGICHDLDHRGFTNNFCTLSNHTLAQLYDESQLENHHIYVTMLILNQCNIFPTMPQMAYKSFCSEIKDAILSSNLAFHFKYRAKLMQLYCDNTFEWHRNDHRFLIKSMMVTISDLSGYAKPFYIVRKLTQNVYNEFYYQGDKEKEMGVLPLSMMDREKKQIIPEDQCQFISVVVLPCADLLRKFLLNTEPLFFHTLNVRETWKRIVETKETFI